MVQQGYCHVAGCVGVHMDRHVEKGPYNYNIGSIFHDHYCAQSIFPVGQIFFFLKPFAR